MAAKALPRSRRPYHAQTFGLDEHPTQRELEALGAEFSPYRSAAAWYFWRSLDVAAT